MLQKGGKASAASSEARLNCARRVHHEVCSLLLSALESLRATLAEFGDLVPAVSFERAKIDYDVAEAGKRLERLSEAAKVGIERGRMNPELLTIVDLVD